LFVILFLKKIPMSRKELRIIYMGTPDFAVAPLKAMIEGGFQVVAVVTMPDKPAGRGMKIQASAVKKYALEVNIPVLQPEKLKEEGFLNALRSYKADIQVVVAFRMLPQVVWSMPPMGTFNLHASLLPKYRGAAPIHWAVIHGETETGVTTFFLKQDIDTGDLLLQERIAIGQDENTGSVHDRLMELGAAVVCKTLDAVLLNQVKPMPQPEGVFAAAPKLTKENTKIDWCQSVQQVHNFVRGLSPFPVAWTEMVDSKDVISTMKIYDAKMELAEHAYAVGSLIRDGKHGLKVALKDGFLHILKLQLAGRKTLNTGEFLQGMPDIDAFRLK
jgi:methionyl-tRNA formyltransferase